MNWTSREIQILVKKAYGNFSDEKILRKAAELRLHLDRHGKAFFAARACAEWAEVERIADELDAAIHGGCKIERPRPARPALPARPPARRSHLIYKEKLSAFSQYFRALFYRVGIKH